MDTFTMEKAIGPLTGISVLKYIPPFSGIYNMVKGNRLIPDIKRVTGIKNILSFS